MSQEHEIVAEVYKAKSDSEAADRLVRQYLPFIKSEAAKLIHRMPFEGQDDELSLAMFAFHEAVLAYNRGRGAFLPFAAKVIRNRLIDYSRKESRHSDLISLDQQENGGDSGVALMERLDTDHDEMSEYVERSAAREEILEFSEVLSGYSLTLTEVADNCPRQARTFASCYKALTYAKEHPVILETLTVTKKLPLSQLSSGSGVERKTLERHRKYMMAILLAYTNGFEIIRGYLNQVSPGKGGWKV